MKNTNHIFCIIAACLSLTLFSNPSAPTVTPLSLATAANASRLDQKAGDGKGGWLDMGSNDLHVLPTGKITLGGVPFEILPDQGEADRSCIVLGRPNGARCATLALSAESGPYLYLLHATADTPQKKKERIGVVRIRYADGTEEKSVRTARDVLDWTYGRSASNALRAWSKYNDNMQVSLFVSKFPIDLKRRPVSVEFDSNGKCPWMILAVSCGADRHLEEERVPLEVKRTYRTPPPRTEPLPEGKAGGRPRNVVLIIGDGMGEGTVDFASRHCHGRPGALTMQQMPVAGHCKTLNASGKTTDSAAAATAIATGTKTSNGVLGLGPAAENTKERETLVPFAQRAHEKGLSVGLLTNDRLTGATPSGFYAHVEGRGETSKIAEQASTCGYEILIGNHGTAGAFAKTDMSACGYVQVKTQQELQSAPKGAKVFGSIDFGGQEETLGTCLKEVLGRLASNRKGFFLMAECATPDGGNHGNKPETTVLGAVQVDWMAATALDFAATRGDTLVIVTADHETGRVRTVQGIDGKAKISYGSTNHTEEPVALFAYGPGSERFKGTIDNTDIMRTVAELTGLVEH